MKAPLCKCGCGKPLTKRQRPPYDWNIYLHGHSNRSVENRKKISKAMTGRKRSKEHCENLAKAMIGRKASVETRRKLRISQRKRFENPEEHEKISKALTGKKLSAECKAKISKAGKGRKVSIETRRKMSKAQKGRMRESERKYKNTGLTPKQYVKFLRKNDVEALSNNYVKNVMCQMMEGLKYEDILDELVDVKRAHLRLGRLLKGK